MHMRSALLIAFLLVALPAAAQEEETEEESARDYSRPKLRDIFLGMDAAAGDPPPDPNKQGIRLFEFQLFGSRTTVRFLPVGPMIAGGTGVEINPIVDPLAMTGTAGSARSPRLRSRFQEWRINRQLGFPLSPPKED